MARAPDEINNAIRTIFSSCVSHTLLTRRSGLFGKTQQSAHGPQWLSDNESSASVQEAAATLASALGGANLGITIAGDSGWRTKSRNTLENTKSQEELADLARRLMKSERA